MVRQIELQIKIGTTNILSHAIRYVQVILASHWPQWHSVENSSIPEAQLPGSSPEHGQSILTACKMQWSKSIYSKLILVDRGSLLSGPSGVMPGQT